MNEEMTPPEAGDASERDDMAELCSFGVRLRIQYPMADVERRDPVEHGRITRP